MYIALFITTLLFWLAQATVIIEDCPAGYYCDATRSVTPQPCPVGTFSLLGSPGCTPCQVGFYQISTGKAFCEECPPGKMISSSSKITRKSSYHLK